MIKCAVICSLNMYRILSHAFFSNYGGILQAFALQKAICGLGWACDTVNYTPHGWCEWLTKQGLRAKLRYWWRLAAIQFCNKHECIPRYLVPARHALFKKCFMHLFHLDWHYRQMKKLTKTNAFIVGSDQVWRCEYVREMGVPMYFLSFATQEQRRRSIAYAASFGSDEWEGTPEETAECAKLIKDFKAVSVREHSGIHICKEVFGVDAVQMPDPTLLLDAEDYSKVIRRWWTRKLPQPFMSVYLLDETEEKKELTQSVAKTTQLYPQQLTAHEDAPKAMDRIPLSVPQWLRCMCDCECVLTDSFHGCVFAIIFNKPFVCLGNEARGSARFDSLLGTFNLQNRLLTNPTAEQVSECMHTPIDWERVNAIRHSEKQRAIQFLKHNLE